MPIKTALEDPWIKMDNLKLVKATLIAPLVTPVIYFTGIYLFGSPSPDGLKDAFTVFMFIAAMSLPVSYAGTIIIGLPVLKLLQSKNRLTAVNLAIAGFVTGGFLFVDIVLYFFGFDHDFLTKQKTALYFLSGGVMGVGVALTFSQVSGITNSFNRGIG